MTEPGRVTIDVMLPYYSHPDSAWEAIRSVLEQTSDSWRLVCVDDAYPGDPIRERLEALGDPRVVYVRNEQNLGLAKNFNRCLDLVEAPYFVMMGDDDRMHPDYIGVLSRLIADNPGVDVFQPGVSVIDESGRHVLPLADRVKRWVRPRVGERGRILDARHMAESLIRADWAYFPSIVWKSEVARAHGFDDHWAVALDLGLLLDIALDGGSMLVTDDVVFDYRRHMSSVSSVTAASGSRFEQEAAFFDEYAARMKAKGWARAARIGRRRCISRLNAASEMVAALAGGDLARARRLFLAAVRPSGAARR